MKHKIFISYKYGDSNVAPLRWDTTTTVRHYVDKLQEYLGEVHINKGEKDNESLDEFKDSTIESKLRDKIFDSSITIVLISPNMKDSTPEKDQWIPWEISYSLKEHTRKDRTSRTNGVLAIVLPDKNNSYKYFMETKQIEGSTYDIFYTSNLFTIIQNNMFNRKNEELDPTFDRLGEKVHTAGHSYIHCVKWDKFMDDYSPYIRMVEEIMKNINNYNIHKM